MADKTLIVVESPAKAKTINKYLGRNYIVEASVGHIKDLTKFKLGVDIKNGFQPKYLTIKGKADIIKRLKQLAEHASKVLIATDPDREGEAIAWHIAEEVRQKNTNVKRVLFNEITKTGIQKGISEPRDIDEHLFMSQQARRVMDRLIGYQVSPFLSRAMLDKTSQSLSAGRVQSVALRLICEREEEIQSFVPIEYWSVLAEFDNQKGAKFKARLVSIDKDNIKNPEGSATSMTDELTKKIQKKLSEIRFIRTESEASQLVKDILKENYVIKDISKKQVKRKPLPPFTTSLLQQEASRRLGFSNKKTMSVAQKLYEGVTLGEEGLAGLITYMRTDSVRLSPEAQKAAGEHIFKTFGKDYLPDSPPVYTTKSANVQDAHEAIRPTSLEYAPSKVRKYLSKDEAELYELIFNRFLASQMNPAVIEQTSVEIEGGRFGFRATGSVIQFKGFLVVYDDSSDEKSNGGKDTATMLPSGLAKSQKLDISKPDAQQSFTKPPARYNEASLVKELDELGIGRPSTYAQIVTTIVERLYVEIQKKAFVPTELGMDANKILVKNFPDLFNVDFTAEMEKELDEVAEGRKSYTDMLGEFYDPFSKSLHRAEEHNDIPEILCDKCNSPMVIRVSRRGRFLGCSRYPECDGTKPLPKGATDKEVKTESVIAEGITCDICGKPMYLRESKYGKFYGCTDYPQCKGTKPFSIGVKCPKCHTGELIERFSPKSKKKFYGCSTYPKCDYITNYEPVAQKCANCGHDYIEVRYKKTEEGFEKYMKCPNCKENFDMI